MSDFIFRRSGVVDVVVTCGPHMKSIGVVMRIDARRWAWRTADSCWSEREYKTRKQAAEALRKAVAK